MGLLSSATTSSDVEQSKDTLGGGFKLLDSDIYLANIKSAYLTHTKKGGINVNVELDIDGHNHTETFFVMNENNETFYTAKDGTKHHYAGYSHANDIALFAVQKELSALKDEPKVLELYNYEQKAKVPTKVPTLTELIGKQVKVAILKEIVNKKVQQGNEWVASDETKEVNTLVKVFSPKDGRTSNEVLAKQENAEFVNKWLEKYKGVTKDSTTKKSSNVGTTSTNVSSLFAS